MLRFSLFKKKRSLVRGKSLSESIRETGAEFLSGTRIRRNSYKKPPFEKLYIYAFLALLAFSLSDISTLILRSKMIPEQGTSKPIKRSRLAGNVVSLHNTLDRNIFDSTGVIPPPLTQKDDPTNMGLDPVPSSLPLQLIGTIVHANPKKSIATIQVQNNQIIPFSTDDKIAELATLLKVDRRRAIFKNHNNNQVEFIQIDTQSLALIPAIKKVPTASAQPVQDQYNMNIDRTDLNRYMDDLPNLLMQARAVPNVVDGRVSGFKIVDIQEGSVWEKLGIKRDDVIKGVNGEAVNSPARAMELYDALKNDNKVGIDIERNGKSETLNFSIM